MGGVTCRFLPDINIVLIYFHKYQNEPEKLNLTRNTDEEFKLPAHGRCVVDMKLEGKYTLYLIDDFGPEDQPEEGRTASAGVASQPACR